MAARNDFEVRRIFFTAFASWKGKNLERKVKAEIEIWRLNNNKLRRFLND